MADRAIQTMADKIAAQMSERLGVGGSSLQAKLRRAGRMLPKGVRKDLRLIVEALSLSDSPKLYRRIDLPRVEAAERRVLAYLRGIDPADRRLGAVLGFAGGLSFNLILLAVGVLALAVWQGLI